MANDCTIQKLIEICHNREIGISQLSEQDLQDFAVPLYDPEQLFDDWNDPEIEKLYEECLLKSER